MTGPYSVEVFLGTDRCGEPEDADLILTWDGGELPEGDAIAGRFYRSGGGATKLGTERAATFAVGALLEPGEEAALRVIGRQPSTGHERIVAGGAYLRRDEPGSLVTTLGSRWSRERRFIGA